MRIAFVKQSIVKHYSI